MYFDYTATTPMDEEILNTYVKVQREYYANTTSLHKLGQVSNQIYENVITNIQNLLGIDHNVVFTSNATEANNLAILGYLKGKKGKVITTKLEHPSVFNVFKELEDEGFDVHYLSCDKNGIIDLDELEKTLDKETLLVSIMWVNNIVGAIEPIDKVIELVKKYPKCKLHCDMVQGITKLKPTFNLNDIDMFTFSAHKFYGPKGIGGLLYKKNLQLNKYIYGSNSQYGIKPGTFDLGLVVCAYKALKKYYELQETNYNYVCKLRDYVFDNLTNDKLIFNSSKSGSPFIINLSFKDIQGETLVHILEEKEIYVSTGSSCSSKIKKPEKTILAMSSDEKRASNSIRISFSHLVSIDDVKYLVEVLNKI